MDFSGHDNLPSYESTKGHLLPAYEPLHGDVDFPDQFSVYEKTGLVRPSSAVIASEESSPLFHVQLATGLLEPGYPLLVLHADSNKYSSFITSVKAAPGGGSYQIQTSSLYPPSLEELKAGSKRGTRRYTFSVPTNPQEKGEGQERQTFEWRPSRSKEVQSLGLRDYGWKLVRLGNELNDAASNTSMEQEESIVAVWSKYSEAGSKKLLGFRFIKDSTSGGSRKTWELMAVVTALTIWHAEITDMYTY